MFNALYTHTHIWGHQTGEFWKFKTQIWQNTNFNDISRICFLKNEFAFCRNTNLLFYFWPIFKTRICQNTNLKTQIWLNKTQISKRQICFLQKSTYSRFIIANSLLQKRIRVSKKRIRVSKTKTNLLFEIRVLWRLFVFSVVTDLCFKTQIRVLKSKFVFQKANPVFTIFSPVEKRICFSPKKQMVFPKSKFAFQKYKSVFCKFWDLCFEIWDLCFEILLIS